MGTLNWNSTWATTDDVSQVDMYKQERILRNGQWLYLKSPPYNLIPYSLL